MTFSDDQNKALDAKLNSLSESLLTQLSEKMNSAVSGMAKRLIEVQLPKTLQDLLPGQIETSLQPAIQTSLDQFLEKLAQDAETEDKKAGETKESDALSELQQQLQLQAANTDSLKEQLAQERKVREQLAEVKRISDFDNAFIEQVNGKVRNPRQLLLLLKNDGRLVEHEGAPKFKTRDEYGLDQFVDVPKLLPDLLKDDAYSHYAPPRAGTGTGASPGEVTRVSQSGQYFQGGTALPDADALMAALNDPSKQDMLFQEAQGLIGR